MLQMKEKLDAYKITEEESKKISIVKVWFTIMVVFIHSNNKLNFASGNFDTPAWLEVLKYFISECISRCAVPGFFLISAILLYKKSFKWKENIKKKIKQIMIPYLIFNTFWILFYVVVQHIPVLSNYFSNPDTIVADWSIIDWLEAYLGFQDNYPICYPLWFLRDLFVLNILAIFIKKLVSLMPYTSLILLLASWIFLDNTNIFCLDKQALCFWGLGCFIVEKGINLKMFDGIKSIYLWVVYIIFVSADMLTRTYIWNRPIHRITIIIGIIFWFTCMTEFKNVIMSKFLMFMVPYSFSIYLFHEMNLTIIKKLCAKLLPTSPIFQLVEYLLIPIFIICCCIILSMILRKWFPHIYAILTGNRTKVSSCGR